jgi:hypothetical protein
MDRKILLQYEGRVDEVKRKYFWCTLINNNKERYEAEIRISIVKKKQLKYLKSGVLFDWIIYKGKNGRNYSDFTIKVKRWTKAEIEEHKKIVAKRVEELKKLLDW